MTSFVAGRVRCALGVVLLLSVLLGVQSAVASPGPAVGGWRAPLISPVRVVRAFDNPARPWLSGHRGVDLAASPGVAVLAPSAGRVVFAGRVVDRGVLVVAHPGGLRSSFEPVTATVAVGTVVWAGQSIGLVDPGHCPDGCLHWGVRSPRGYLDPMRFIVPDAVLLPIGAITPSASHPGRVRPRPRPHPGRRWSAGSRRRPATARPWPGSRSPPRRC